MLIGIPETVPITFISDVNSFHLCKYNLIQLPCAFIWSTPYTCKACSKGINISFCGAFCPSCSILVCCYVDVLTSNETVGVACSGLLVVLFVVC